MRTSDRMRERESQNVIELLARTLPKLTRQIAFKTVMKYWCEGTRVCCQLADKHVRSECYDMLASRTLHRADGEILKSLTLPTSSATAQ